MKRGLAELLAGVAGAPVVSSASSRSPSCRAAPGAWWPPARTGRGWCRCWRSRSRGGCAARGCESVSTKARLPSMSTVSPHEPAGELAQELLAGRRRSRGRGRRRSGRCRSSAARPRRCRRPARPGEASSPNDERLAWSRPPAARPPRGPISARLADVLDDAEEVRAAAAAPAPCSASTALASAASVGRGRSCGS